MTGDVVERVAVSVVAMATTSAAAFSLDAGTILTLIVGTGSGAVAGWFAAQVTTEHRLTRIETLLKVYLEGDDEHSVTRRRR